MQMCVIALVCEVTMVSSQLKASVHVCMACIVHDLYRLVTAPQVAVLSAQLGSQKARSAGQKGLMHFMC